MTNRTKNILMGTAALALLAGAAFAEETKIRKEVYENVQELPGVKAVKFSDFDTNKDGNYTMAEVGERLFDSFDLDENDAIDNQEWSTRSVMTITPIEKETFKFVDYGNDGDVDYTDYSYNTFYKESGLIKFDANKNGLSAKEFIGKDFQALDTSDNNLIEMDEWKAVYTESFRPSASKANYN